MKSRLRRPTFQGTVQPMIQRARELAILTGLLHRHPVVGIVHAGDHSFPLAECVRAVALRRLLDDVEPLA